MVGGSRIFSGKKGIAKKEDTYFSFLSKERHEFDPVETLKLVKRCQIKMSMRNSIFFVLSSLQS